MSVALVMVLHASAQSNSTGVGSSVRTSLISARHSPVDGVPNFMRWSAISFCIPSQALRRSIAEHPLSMNQKDGRLRGTDVTGFMLRRAIHSEPEVGLSWGLGQGHGAKVSIRQSHCRVGPEYLRF